MVIINISPLDYKYDIETLARAFYGNERFFVNKEPDRDESITASIDVVFKEDGFIITIDNTNKYIKTDLSDRRATKNIIKRELYKLLSEKTGK